MVAREPMINASAAKKSLYFAIQLTRENLSLNLCDSVSLTGYQAGNDSDDRESESVTDDWMASCSAIPLEALGCQ